MTPSPAAYALIREFEGFRSAAYQCSAKVWTIGYGHTAGVKQGQRCSESEAETWLRSDTLSAADAVNKAVMWPISQGQFDALVSFVFNLGAGAFGKSTLLKLINAGDIEAAANQFERWVFADRRESEGLKRRRRAEKALFLAK